MLSGAANEGAAERAAPLAPAVDESGPARRTVHLSPQSNGRPARHREAQASITGIGFHPASGGTVIIRSDRPLEVAVTEDAHGVRLHIPDATIPLPNNRRPLDTSFFGGDVERVVPSVAADGIDLRIELRGPAAARLQQDGGVLRVTFEPHGAP